MFSGGYSSAAHRMRVSQTVRAATMTPVPMTTPRMMPARIGGVRLETAEVILTA